MKMQRLAATIAAIEVGADKDPFEIQSDFLRSQLVPVPADASDVCPMCRSWRHQRFEYCSNCLQVLGELTAPCRRVVPITLYRKPSPLRDWLKYYKHGGEEYHPEYGQYLSLIIRRFMRDNKNSLSRSLGGFSIVCLVPSSSRDGKHPLQSIVESYPIFDARVEEILERGNAPLAHRLMDDRAFVVRKDISGERILVIDDVYTTGARAQSAASALSIAGATTVGIFVIARRINPEFNVAACELWSRQRNIPYRFEDGLAWLR